MILEVMDDRTITDSQAALAYVTWSLACVVHGFQILHLREQHPILKVSVPIFVALSTAFLLPFSLCQWEADSCLTTARYPLFIVLEAVCVVHITFVQYALCIWPLAAGLPLSERSNRGILREPVIWIGLCAQGILLALGIWLLIEYNIELIWAAPTIAHFQFLVLLTHHFVKAPQSRKASLLGWLIFVAFVALLSMGSLVADLVMKSRSAQVFPVQCCLALVDSGAAIIRFRSSQKRRQRRETEDWGNTTMMYPIASPSITQSNPDFLATKHSQEGIHVEVHVRPSVPPATVTRAVDSGMI